MNECEFRNSDEGLLSAVKNKIKRKIK